MKRLVLIAMVVLMSASIVLAQDFCESDFDCNGAVDANDVSTFLEDFGRSQFFNPCPPCVPLEPVLKTRQTQCWDETGTPRDCVGTGEDGEYQLGVEKYTDNGDGTISDNFSGLMWLKDANCIATHYPDYDLDGWVTWQQALDFVKGMNDGSYPLCGVGHIDWRLPNLQELLTIMEKLAPPLFINVQYPGYYMSSTTNEDIPSQAFAVHATSYDIGGIPKTTPEFFLPVRGGH